MSEIIFRILGGSILFCAISISGYYRRKADKLTGEKVSRKVDGSILMNIIRLFGLFLWLSPVVYLVNPVWMEWSKIWLPQLMRWIGVGLCGACLPLIYWLFSSIGTGITPTGVTRREHKLVTSGPYRWVRHPLYTIGSSLFFGFGLVADNWFFMLLAVLAFVVMAIRTPREEANLIDKFGDEYRGYMKRTGRFLPRIMPKR